MHNQVGIFWVICYEMHRIIVFSVHAWVHHEDAGCDVRALAGLEDHRTDGQLGRSASLQNFDIRLLFEAQPAVAVVGDFDPERSVLAKFDIPVVDVLLVNSDPGRPTGIPAAPAGNQERSQHQQDAAQGYHQPGKASPLPGSSAFSTHRGSAWTDWSGIIFQATKSIIVIWLKGLQGKMAEK